MQGVDEGAAHQAPRTPPGPVTGSVWVSPEPQPPAQPRAPRESLPFPFQSSILKSGLWPQFLLPWVPHTMVGSSKAACCCPGHTPFPMCPPLAGELNSWCLLCSHPHQAELEPPVPQARYSALSDHDNHPERLWSKVPCFCPCPPPPSQLRTVGETGRRWARAVPRELLSHAHSRAGQWWVGGDTALLVGKGADGLTRTLGASHTEAGGSVCGWPGGQ